MSQQWKRALAGPTMAMVMILSCAAGIQTQDPVYVRTENGWKGLFAHGDQYAEYSCEGLDIKLQDPNHILLKPKLGMMVAFADKKQFATDGDILATHAQWELEYWRHHASRVESTTRTDLSGPRSDIKITEITLYNTSGAQTKMDLLALASKEGVFALALSPVDGSTDSVVKEIVDSFRLVSRKLDDQELKRISSEIRLKR